MERHRGKTETLPLNLVRDQQQTSSKFLSKDFSLEMRGIFKRETIKESVGQICLSPSKGAKVSGSPSQAPVISHIIRTLILDKPIRAEGTPPRPRPDWDLASHQKTRRILLPLEYPFS
jgi:hypothetical protein